MNQIKVTIDQANNEISVWNNGKGVPIEIHKEHNVYVPEMIFGKQTKLIKSNSLYVDRLIADLIQLRWQRVEGDRWQEWFRCQTHQHFLGQVYDRDPKLPTQEALQSDLLW